MLRLEPDHSFERELSAARTTLLDSALVSLGGREDEPAARVSADYHAERAVAADPRHPRAATESDRLRLRSIVAQRETLAGLRRAGTIDDDVFHALEQELDWAELAASPPERSELVEG
jgi:CPA1 family monovalent cation:H+ antiporter